MCGSKMKPPASETGSREEVDCDLRPGGVLVQKREDGLDSTGPMIKVNVYHDTNHHEVFVPAKSAFGELKRVLAQKSGLDPKEQRILFRGKEKNDDERLHMAGVKDMSKLVLLRDPAIRENLEEMQMDQRINKACESVASVSAEVDELVDKVNSLGSAVHGGAKVEDQEFVVLTELLMRQLLKLDSIEAEGEAKVRRRTEVRRVQQYVDMLDALKARNSNPISNSRNAVSVTSQWETFDSGVGSLTAPAAKPCTQISNDWEKFD